MKGVIADCKTGKIKEVEDGLPMPVYPPHVEPEGLNLAEVSQILKEFTQLKADVDKLKKKGV